MTKKTYYVNIATQEISQIPYGTNTQFTIEATDEEVFLLREKFNEVRSAEFSTYIRAHIPFVPYHNDPENDAYDEGLSGAYQMIYKLGTEETKAGMKREKIGEDYLEEK
ncbi:hydrolase [Gracilibacillus marinus]|uniref:Hydrolase n=1 Tax=Gracilibacillus marinus TaxID=630535 RepID=A0ABV8VVY6_9BACI